MRILYVEDNPANVFLVKRVAKMGRHEIINFIDGGEAIRKYDDVNPDLVLMDIQLVGETSGLEVVKQLRGRGVTTPIIAVTAYAMVGDKERCMEAGCNDYLAKPLPIPRLIEIFQEYDVSSKATRPSTPAQTAPKVVEPTPTKVAPAGSEVDEASKVAEASSTSPEKTQTKTTEPSEAAAIPTVTETDAKAQVEVNKTDVAQPEKPSSDVVSNSIHEDVTLPVKPTAKSTPAVEKPNTKTSTTEANG